MSRDPNLPPDSDYYAARAIEERRLAMASADPKVRAIHLSMAEKYAELAKTGGQEPAQVIGEQQNRA
ncbi:MAG TPA: hypothetical protein VHN55_05360 [Sphingomicrobium sp.]|nr:hypothetical protein [Sphingomicrobium sp.]